MIVRRLSALACAVFLFGACSNAGGTAYQSAPLDSDDQKASYAIGLNVGSQLADARDRLDRQAFLRGVDDALQSNDPAVPRDELQAILQTFGQEIQEAANQARAVAAEENIAEGEEFLAENAAREEVMVTESGLQYEILREGDGASPTAEDRVRVHYRGTLIDGTEFDSSYDGEPVTFAAGQLIPGFTEALLMMSEGAHWRIAIPSSLAYGPAGSGGVIGPNETLIFEIELFEVVE
ncbi:MAG: FKBP-type peptidyl-prolyl cis-trans isomerase [Longimicrobiales bacterium]|nr:FKBP-type peptidyl-prolyl cis-trans isomerase [Longimicrobiales bacterium]